MILPLPIPTDLATRWHARTTPTHDGHLEWVGHSGIVWQQKTLSQPAIGFALHTGRTPIGYARQDCGHPKCILPGHLLDDPGRYQNRLMLRTLRGLPPVGPRCRRDHDQTIEGRLDGDGNAYCIRCAHPGTETPVIRLHGEHRKRAARTLQVRYEAGASIRELMAETGRTYGYVHDLLVLAGVQFRRPGHHPEFHTRRGAGAG
ncbi:helix-turn-helix domain-containing protein [Streptomyces sp. NBC_01476]|uniref:helix-turn-helix domain-containing protein n=1 Tax=Streptomyces sp. NBC_01476 TaxID=2903881 RepID=UPI002E3172F9|nr:helix-turn-helix domain-containing protein [Streptomyces sp. NBC_01476]